jgi:hypothetical protein
MPGPPRNAPGDYARERSSRQADRRLLERLTATGAEVVKGRDVVKPPPDPSWSETAKMVWTVALHDEAVDRWGAGDYLQLSIACEYVSRLFSADGRRPPADGVRVLIDTLNGLQLSDTAKRRAGLFVDRSGNDYSDPIDAEIAEL